MKKSIIQAQIKAAGKPEAEAPASLLGVNLEIHFANDAALTNDRLQNAKFLGPADPNTGIPWGWRRYPHHNTPGVRFQLVRGVSLSGQESLVMDKFAASSVGICQPNIRIQKGEILEVSFWAAAQHHPMELQVSLRPTHIRKEAYAEAAVKVHAPYWKEYRAALTVAADDENAVFVCRPVSEGIVRLDQIHLRPAKAGHLNHELLDRVRRLDIPLLRFPGGGNATNYHWRHGTGPQHLRPALFDPVCSAPQNSYEFGADEFLALCQEFNITPMITVAIGSGTPQEAEEWAAYCAAWHQARQLKPPPMYWQIGNEEAGAWEHGNMTGEMYVETLREFVPGIRRAYPNARVIALGAENYHNLKETGPWRRLILDQAAEHFDLLSLHPYAISAWENDPAVRQGKILQISDKGMQTVRDLIADLQARGLHHKKAAVTEWGLWLKANSYDEDGFFEPNDTEHCLFFAGRLYDLVRLAPWLEVSCYYNLLNAMGIFLCRGGRVVETGMVNVYRMFRPAFPGQRLPLKITSPALVDDLPVIDGMCLNNSQGAWLFLSNRSANREAKITVEGLGTPEEHYAHAGEHPEAEFRQIDIRKQDGALCLPPLSCVRLRYRSIG